MNLKPKPWVGKVTRLLVFVLAVSCGVLAALFFLGLEKRVTALEQRPVFTQKIVVVATPTPSPVASVSAKPVKKVTLPTVAPTK